MPRPLPKREGKSRIMGTETNWSSSRDKQKMEEGEKLKWSNTCSRFYYDVTSASSLFGCLYRELFQGRHEEEKGCSVRTERRADKRKKKREEEVESLLLIPLVSDSRCATLINLQQGRDWKQEEQDVEDTASTRENKQRTAH